MKKIEIPSDFDCSNYGYYCTNRDGTCPILEYEHIIRCTALDEKKLQGKTIYIADKNERLYTQEELDSLLETIEGWICIEALRQENKDHPLCKVKDYIKEQANEEDVSY